MIVYKYVFSSELKLPLMDDVAFEITDNSFIVHIIPDNLKFDYLKLVIGAFDKFDVMFLPNSYNVVKLEFILKGE